MAKAEKKLMKETAYDLKYCTGKINNQLFIICSKR